MIKHRITEDSFVLDLDNNQIIFGNIEVPKQLKETIMDISQFENQF